RPQSPIVLEIQTVNGGAGQPGSQLLGERCRTYRAQQEAGEVVAGTGQSGASRLKTRGHTGEGKASTGSPDRTIIQPVAKQFVPHLEGVGSRYLRQVIAKGKCLPDTSS